jgi:hypothetical protein
MHGLVWLLLLFGLCFAVERAVRELRGRAPTLLTKARWLVGLMLVGYLGGVAFDAGSYLLFHLPLTWPLGQ